MRRAKMLDGGSMHGSKRHIVLAILLLLFAASTAAPAENDIDISKGAASEDAPSGDEIWQRPLTFVQEAGRGALIKNADGNRALVLQSVVPYTMYYSGPPEEVAGSVPMESFIAGFGWSHRNASLSLLDADEKGDTFTLEISSPRYDNQTETLSYSARIIEDQSDLSCQESQDDAGIPERFGRVRIVLSWRSSPQSTAASAQSGADALEASPLENESVRRHSTRILQEAGGGTFERNADGGYTLALYDVVPYTMYYSDPPWENPGFTPMERFIAGFNWSHRNASLSLLDADEKGDTFTLEISSPRYDNKTKTLSYAARVIEDPSLQISRAEAILNGFGRARIVLSAYCEDAEWHCCPVKGSIQKDIKISCCYSSNFCVPCEKECHYKTQCRKTYGGKAGDYTCGNTCRPAPP